MKIRFGLHLDGQRGWRPGNRLGEPVMGPLSLLSLLETQLGIAGDFPGHAERVVQYREFLKVCDTSSRFYHDTFGTDELGTAGRLLEWRDSWHLHGWNGMFGNEVSLRLKDMAVVEVRAAGRMGPSMGERLKRVAHALARRQSAIQSISLIERLEAFPRAWREVLAMLPVGQYALPGQNGTGSLLGKLQAALSRAQLGDAIARMPWSGDGSVRVVRAETRLTAAHWLAGEIRNAKGDWALVAEMEGALLDTVLNAADGPRHGLEEKNEFRPALQLLPLAFQVLWEPLDFYALIKFLTHPVSPLPGRARSLLAAELAERPGIGGKTWNVVLERITSLYGEKGSSVWEQIGFWIEHSRYKPREGVPIAVVHERVQRLMDYFAAQMGAGDGCHASHFAMAYAQAASLAANLQNLARQGEAALLPRTLQTLVKQAAGFGTANPLTQAEVGCSPAVTDPAALIEPFERVIWWQLGAPSMPRRYPWSQREMRELAEAGVDLPPLDKVLERTAAEWLRGIFAATKELVLVLPPEGEEVHPLWLMIEALVERVPVESAEQVLSNAKAGAGLVKVDLQPLPQPKRWWQLPQDVSVARRKLESYSSLDIFLNNPYEWVLQYAARLRPSNILSVSGDFLLFGNLAHGLIERLYRAEGALALSPAAIERWFDETFPQIVREEGAVLLMRGRRPDLLKLRAGLKRALLALHEHLAKSDVGVIEPERRLEGSFVGGGLSGVADLVVARPDGRCAILDLKWSGRRKYTNKLAEGRHLQLAIYGELMRQGTGVWPDVAYFILDQAQLIAPDAGFFPEARVVPGQEGEPAARLWQRFIESWKWRRGQLDAGQIEVVLDDIEQTADSAAPEEGLALEVRDPRYNHYLILSGLGQS